MRSITPVRIDSRKFAGFGVVARFPAAPPLAETSQFKYWSDSAHYDIEGEAEIGYCTVYRPEGDVVNWMERHERTPEVLIPIDGDIVLPVMTDGDIAAFTVAPGEAAVIGQNVWHSACLPSGKSSASYFVIFRRGTPHEDVIKEDLPLPVRIEL